MDAHKEADYDLLITALFREVEALKGDVSTLANVILDIDPGSRDYSVRSYIGREIDDDAADETIEKNAKRIIKRLKKWA